MPNVYLLELQANIIEVKDVCNAHVFIAYLLIYTKI